MHTADISPSWFLSFFLAIPFEQISSRWSTFPEAMNSLCVLLLASECQFIPAISWVKLVKAGYNWLKNWRILA